MSAIGSGLATPEPDTFGPIAWIKRHPLASFFVLAYAFSWVFSIPIMLSQRGLGLFTLPDPLLLVLFLAATFIGPTPAAFIVLGLTEGRPGVVQWLRRMAQWRVGLKWYILVTLGYPLIFLLGLTVPLGAAFWSDLAQKWPLIFSAYLPLIPLGLLYPAIGEEPGWRGFALPRLQVRFGPVLASLILGALHACWHLPAYFIPGAISDTGFSPAVFVGNSLAIVAFSLIWTWLFNNASGSVFFAMFVHATSNANSAFLGQVLPHPLDDPFFGFKVGAVVALLVIVFTRGRLSYKSVS